VKPQTPPVEPKTGKKEPGTTAIEVIESVTYTGDDGVQITYNPATVAAEKAVKIMLKGILNRYAIKESKAIATAASKPREFSTFIETFYDKHQSQMVEGLESVCEASQTLGGDYRAVDIAVRWCVDSKAELVSITDTATMATLSDEVENKLKTWSTRVAEYVKEKSCTP
jgi:hypothetical protein